MASASADTTTVVDILASLISIPSVNPMGKDVDGPIYFEGRVSDWLVQFFESIGAEHERIEAAPGRDNVVARFTSPTLFAPFFIAVTTTFLVRPTQVQIFLLFNSQS